MDHIAIMKKSWNLARKILSGEKTIESRWYLTRRAPWGKIRTRERIYFKEAGGPITVRASVARVIELEGLDPGKIREILDEHAAGIGVEKDLLYEMHKGKRYCILVFLESPERVEPFEIDKKGFGTMSAWLCVDDITRVKNSVP